MQTVENITINNILSMQLFCSVLCITATTDNVYHLIYKNRSDFISIKEQLRLRPPISLNIQTCLWAFHVWALSPETTPVLSWGAPSPPPTNPLPKFMFLWQRYHKVVSKISFFFFFYLYCKFKKYVRQEKQSRIE